MIGGQRQIEDEQLTLRKCITVVWPIVIAVTVGAISWSTARADIDPLRPGLSAYYQLWRVPNAYEGEFLCQSACRTRQQDAGLYDKLIEERDVDASRCIEKLITKSKSRCPRIGW